MSKIYDLYPAYERKIDNWRKRILGYEKMKRDLQRQIQILRNKNKKQKEVIDEAINYIVKETKDVQKAIKKLQQENKILKENAENNDKVVDKVNWENQLLKKENKQLKDNWNKLKEYCKENTLCYEVGDDENTKLIGSKIHGLNVLDKMQELEQGSDSNE